MTEISTRLPVVASTHETRQSDDRSTSFDQALDAPGLMGHGREEDHRGADLGDRYVDSDDLGGAPTIARK